MLSLIGLCMSRGLLGVCGYFESFILSFLSLPVSKPVASVQVVRSFAKSGNKIKIILDLVLFFVTDNFM